MAKRLKRAFTITELVIVIAVVAILAAVLIPTFMNIIKKADESADTQLVKNLNTILSSEQTVSQEAAPTMSEAIAQAQEGGYTVDKLTPTSDGDILWEQDSNRFVLVSGGKIIFKDSTTTASIQDEPYKFWKITNEDGEIQTNTAGYSYYLGNNYSGGKTLEVTAGLDVGEQAIEKITYTTEKEQAVVFNTSGGTLEIDAPNSNVKHYGSAEYVDISAVDYNSYYLYGDVARDVVVEQGRVYFEATASVTGSVKAQPKVNAESNSIIIDGSSSANIASIVVTINAGSTTSVNISSSMEQYRVDDTYVEGVDKTLSQIADTYFGGRGMGTEKYPFEIANEAQLLNISVMAAAGENTTYYFQQTDDIEIAASSWFQNGKYVALDMAGVYDGGGHEIKISESLVGSVNVSNVTLFNPQGEVLIKNLKTCSSANCLVSVCGANGCRSLTLENIEAYSENNVIVQIAASNAGPLVTSHIYPSDSGDDFSITIDNCHVNLRMSNTQASTGVFIGGDVNLGWDCKNGAVIQILNSSFTGVVQSTNAGLIFGNGYSISNSNIVEKIKSQIIVRNVVNNGILRSTGSNDATMFGMNNVSTKELHEYFSAYVTGGTYTKNTNVLSSVKNVKAYYQDGQYVVTGEGLSNTYTYKLALTTTILASDITEYSGRSILLDVNIITGASSADTLKVGGIYLESVAREQNIIPKDLTLSYDKIYDAIFTMSLYINSDNNLYIIMKDPDESGYPKPKDNKFTMTLYAYDKDGYNVGNVAVGS